MTAIMPRPERGVSHGRARRRSGDDDPAAAVAPQHRLQGEHDPSLRPRDPGCHRRAPAGRPPRRRARRRRGARRADAATDGIAIGIGVNPWYGLHDPETMAYAAVDEAIRNVVAVGADPDRVALLDNFSWGDPRRASTLGELVAAVDGCVAAATRLPGTVRVRQGLAQQRVHRRRRAAPLGATDAGDHRRRPRARRRSLRDAGAAARRRRLVLLLGTDPTRVRRSHLDLVARHAASARRRAGTRPRRARALPPPAPGDPATVWSRACHDLSEGGLAVALAEMCIAGRLGIHVTDAPARRPRHGAVRRIAGSARRRGRAERDLDRLRADARRRTCSCSAPSPTTTSSCCPACGPLAVTELADAFNRIVLPEAVGHERPCPRSSSPAPAPTATATWRWPCELAGADPVIVLADRARRRSQAARRGPSRRHRRRLLLRRRARRRPHAGARSDGRVRRGAAGVRRHRTPADRHLQRLPGAHPRRAAARRARPQRPRPLRVPLGRARTRAGVRVPLDGGIDDPIHCPIAHGEGRYVHPDPARSGGRRSGRAALPIPQPERVGRRHRRRVQPRRQRARVDAASREPRDRPSASAPAGRRRAAPRPAPVPQRRRPPRGRCDRDACQPVRTVHRDRPAARRPA